MFKRLQMQIPASPSLPDESSLPETTASRGIVQEQSLANSQYSFFLPQHYEPNYAYPLLIWLHGKQGNERQIHRVLPLVSMRNYAAVGIRGNQRSGSGYDWSVDTTGSFDAAEQSILDAIDSARERFNVHSHRIFLAGYQSGGALAVKLALRRPSEFAGAVSLGGSLPTGSHLFGNLSKARKFPLLISQGQNQNSSATDDLCDRLRLFHAANLQVMVRLYPGDHELTTRMLSDMNEWIMERVTGMPAREEEERAVSVPGDVRWN